MMKVIEMECNEYVGDGVFAMSIVDEPANNRDFVALGKIQPIKLTVENDEKRLLTGIVLEPDVKILRRNDETGEIYFITFPEKTIETAAHLFMKANAHQTATLQHAGIVEGLRVVESWLVADSDNDKTNALGIKAKKNSWAITMKIDNNDIWENHVKTGLVKGFSLEGFFSDGRVIDEPAKIQRKLKSARF